MRDLDRIKDECLKDVIDAGITPGNITQWSVNPRLKRLWGRCTRRVDTYTIEIAERLLNDDRISEKAIKNTVVHEILHTAKDGMNHTKKWKEYAEIMNKTYGYNIKRLTSGEEKGVENYEIKPRAAKYWFQCKKCRKIVVKKRKCNFTKHFRNYSCPYCGMPRAFESY